MLSNSSLCARSRWIWRRFRRAIAAAISHTFSAAVMRQGYYAYLWTQMLADDGYQWFVEQGGLTRENGQRFREAILSRGNSCDLEALYRELARARSADRADVEKSRFVGTVLPAAAGFFPAAAHCALFGLPKRTACYCHQCTFCDHSQRPEQQIRVVKIHNSTFFLHHLSAFTTNNAYLQSAICFFLYSWPL